MNRYIIFLLVILLPILSKTNPGPVPPPFPARAIQQTSTAPLDPSRILFQEIATSLIKPVFITNAGDGSGRLFVLELAGQIRIIKNGVLLSTPFLDIRSIVKSTASEQGLLALAFHPSFSTNGEFFVAYTAHRNGDVTGSNLVLEKYSVSAVNPDRADAASGIILLSIAHPDNTNHNGGTLAFGPDGYLYWSTGDGGGGGDPGNNAQNLGSLLGKILRIDVDSGSPYGIPSNNPFFSSMDPNVKKEIWAYGLRNPWRFSFDKQTGDLYIGDVGQSVREEIDFQSAGSEGGENYGWRVMEGSLCYNPSSGCNQSGKVLPVAEYEHTLGCAVTGGYVYRGSKFLTLYGQYFYADYCSGRFFSLHNDPGAGWEAVQLADTPYTISTFGEDEQGELYLANYGTGKIYNIGYQEGVVTVTIANTNMGSSAVSDQTSLRKSYPGINNGPVRVMSTLPIVASERVAYFNGSAWTSHSELMGLPVSQLTTSYTFPWYNNVDLNSQLRFGNVGTVPTTVTVTIGGMFKGNYNLAPNASTRISYPGLDMGPVKVTSSGGVPITASMRVAYFDGSNWTSFSEMMGLPSPKLTHSYVFPWYNNVDLNSQLRFGNVGTVPTTVTVTIGGVFKGNYNLQPNTGTRISYPGLDSGPVRITSSGNVPIIASMRVAYFDGGAWTDFSEIMGLPIGSLSTNYSFPIYDNVLHNSQLRFGNVGNVNTNVTVTINGILRGSYALTPNESKRISYTGLEGGPVVVQSSGGVPIIASERVAYFTGSEWTNFAEMMGLPQAQLSTTFVFPWYNNVDIDTQLRFGIP